MHTRVCRPLVHICTSCKRDQCICKRDVHIGKETCICMHTRVCRPLVHIGTLCKRNLYMHVSFTHIMSLCKRRQNFMCKKMCVYMFKEICKYVYIYTLSFTFFTCFIHAFLLHVKTCTKKTC